MLVDTHAHIGGGDTDEAEVISDLEKGCPDRIVCASYDVASSERSVLLARKHEKLYCAVGVHPSDSQRLTSDPCEKLFSLASDRKNKVVAIGEIGLDYHYDDTDREMQKKWLTAQIALADELKLPPMFHIRDAYEDMTAIFAENAGKLTRSGVMHCYSGSKETAQELSRKYDFYFSFSGVITFKNAKKYPEIIRALPLSRLLVETDCPYMAPEPHRGEANKPAFVCFVAQKLAGILDMPYDEVVRITGENAARIYGIK